MTFSSRRRKTHQVQITFSDEKVTSFGGMILEHRLASRLGLWTMLEKRLPSRDGQYSWMDIIQSGIAGLLSGARGTFATQALRDDQALLELLDLEGAPEEATFWRCLEGLGRMTDDGVLGRVQADWTRTILGRLKRPDLLECDGFFPIFADGTLLEGSLKREGTKTIKDKGNGLLWGTIFAGPLVASQGLAKAGQGEQTLIRRQLPEVVGRILKPLKLVKKSLLLADALHGNEPTLKIVEQHKLSYIVGAGALVRATETLQAQPESQWHELGTEPKRGWERQAVCQCWFQGEDWTHKRLLIGRRVVREGEMFPTYYGVLTNLTSETLGASDTASFARAVWRLYDAKGRMELNYKELLSDLNLHHPPCREHVRNAGFYGLATLAHTLGVGVKLIGESGNSETRHKKAKATRDGMPERIRIKPGRGMRLWRVRRTLLTLPARVSRHARRLGLELLGVSAGVRELFERWYGAIARC